MKTTKQDRDVVAAPPPVMDIDSLAGRIGALNGVSVEQSGLGWALPRIVCKKNGRAISIVSKGDHFELHVMGTSGNHDLVGDSADEMVAYVAVFT